MRSGRDPQRPPEAISKKAGSRATTPANRLGRATWNTSMPSPAPGRSASVRAPASRRVRRPAKSADTQAASTARPWAASAVRRRVAKSNPSAAEKRPSNTIRRVCRTGISSGEPPPPPQRPLPRNFPSLPPRQVATHFHFHAEPPPPPLRPVAPPDPS